VDEKQTPFSVKIEFRQTHTHYQSNFCGCTTVRAGFDLFVTSDFDIILTSVTANPNPNGFHARVKIKEISSYTDSLQKWLVEIRQIPVKLLVKSRPNNVLFTAYLLECSVGKERGNKALRRTRCSQQPRWQTAAQSAPVCWPPS